MGTAPVVKLLHLLFTVPDPVHLLVRQGVPQQAFSCCCCCWTNLSAKGLAIIAATLLRRFRGLSFRFIFFKTTCQCWSYKNCVLKAMNKLGLAVPSSGLNLA